ncbi:MAG: ornithine cyclodeaminase family protein [Solirubrobacterales bacterium]|nr:ornithine cyclodeaminase family protein [Solirubrobacterales bacterium]
MRVLLLSADDVRQALAPAACERAMAQVLVARARGQATNPLRTVMRVSGATTFMGLMPAYASTGGSGTFAVKALCLAPTNPSRGLDTHQGVVTLFDGVTGMPQAILNASAVTEVRTAAVTAAATRLLARPDARRLAILGAGVQARSHLRALAAVRPWTEVRVFAPTSEHARALGEIVPEVTVAASAQEALDDADVVTTVTSALEPVLDHLWLASGAHVNAIGASSLSARELPVRTVAAAALYCDSRESLRHEASEFRLAIEQGLIDEHHVRAELGEVLAGLAAGRRSPDELTVFRSLGIGVEDLAAASLAVDVAHGRGLGVEVDL